jgi:hypothetical protein
MYESRIPCILIWEWKEGFLIWESSKKKEGFFDLPFSFFPYKNNSIKIKLSNLQERNVCYV